MQGMNKRQMGRIAVIGAGILALSLWASPDTAFADRGDRDRQGPQKPGRGMGKPGRGNGQPGRRMGRPDRRIGRQDHPGRQLGHRKNRRPAPRADRRYGYRHDRRNWNRDFRSGPPKRFRHDHYNRYRAYNYGRVYHRGHGHYHAGYRFPYWTSAGYWSYRPYYYCGDRLFASGRIELFGPNFGISVGF